METSPFTLSSLCDLSHTVAAPFLATVEQPWDALDCIDDWIRRLGEALPPEEYFHPAPTVWIHRTAHIYDSAFIGENVYIGPATEVRHSAFIRGNALVGAGAVVGNSTELKNVILFDEVQVPHYNYVGDSILGYRAHMGAGSITSNVKGDKSPVHIDYVGRHIATGRKKLGALLGDRAEIGCGCVLNPGTVIGADARVYPLSSVRGFIPPACIFKGVGAPVPICPDSEKI